MKWKIEEGKVRNGNILETDKERDELVAGKIRDPPLSPRRQAPREGGGVIVVVMREAQGEEREWF